METLLQSGLDFVLAFQQMGGWLLKPMQFFTFLGTENFYILLLPILYWCVDSKLGLQVGVAMLFSTSVYNSVKLFFHSPRPYWYSANVQPLSAESSFGLPSGHAQGAATVWGTVGVYYRKKWVWALSIFLILGISLSRIYLGVHFPVDMLLGWALGALIVWALTKLWKPVQNWLQTKSLGAQIFYAFALSMSLLLIGWIAYLRLADWTMPAVWMENAARGADDLPAPVSMSGILTATGTLFGLLAGLAFMEKKGGFTATGPWSQRLVRYLIGMLGLAAIYIGLKIVFPSGESFLPSLLRYVRYTLVGFWVSGLAPWIFVKLQLANKA